MRPWGRASAAGVAALVVLGGVWSCAEPEPTVVVYMSAGAEIAAWIEGAFQASHPGQVIRLEPVSGAEALERLRAEAASPTADVWMGAPSWLMAKGAAEGLLARSMPAWGATVPEDMRDARGRWTGWVADPVVLAFNSERTSRSRAPRDWIDVLHPRWVEDVLLPDPRGSEAMAAFIGTRVARMRTEGGDDTPGFDWLARLDATRKGYVTDGAELVRRLGVGEVSVALLPLSLAETAKEGGRPVDFRIPESGSPTLVRGVGSVAGGPHAAAGAAFVTWLGSPDVRVALAEQFAQMPAVGGALEAEASWVTDLRPLIRFEVVPADTLATHLDGWLARWRDEVMGRTRPTL